MTTQPATAPTTPAAQPQCLHPSCHAHNAHPGNRPQNSPAMPVQPPAAPSTPWYRKITKNMVIGFLIVIIIGLAGSLNTDDHKIANLKAKASHSATQSTQSSQMAKLQYAIAYCGQVAAKGDGPECIQETLTAQH
jgi:hypothetical protein